MCVTCHDVSNMSDVCSRPIMFKHVMRGHTHTICHIRWPRRNDKYFKITVSSILQNHQDHHKITIFNIKIHLKFYSKQSNDVPPFPMSSLPIPNIFAYTIKKLYRWRCSYISTSDPPTIGSLIQTRAVYTALIQTVASIHRRKGIPIGGTFRTQPSKPAQFQSPRSVPPLPHFALIFVLLFIPHFPPRIQSNRKCLQVIRHRSVLVDTFIARYYLPLLGQMFLVGYPVTDYQILRGCKVRE